MNDAQVSTPHAISVTSCVVSWRLPSALSQGRAEARGSNFHTCQIHGWRAGSVPQLELSLDLLQPPHGELNYGEPGEGGHEAHGNSRQQ